MMPFKTCFRWTWPVLTGLVFLALWFAPRAFAQNAQTDDRLASLNIAVWPEYDQPLVLVQYDGELAAKDPLPRDISLLVPTGAQINAAAYVASNGDYLNTDAPKTQDQGDGFTLVTFSLPATKFHLEYYYDALKGSPDKTMEFAYKAAEAADNVQLEIQQPLKAENFTTDPAAPIQTTDAHQFIYHVFNYATLNAGQVQRIKVSYTKSDPNPSIANLPTPAPASTQTSSAAGPSIPLVPAALVASGVALLALGGFAWWSRNRQVPVLVEAPEAGTRRKRGAGGLGGFCSQCGRALAADDNFCPRCGTKKRNS
jgi:zinc-ribbon domain